VMEYITGKTVAQMISEQGPLPAPVAAELARQVALGLEHLHLKDLLHRDVNPSNILIDQQGTAKLTDLGLAIDQGDEAEIVTRDGATVGTFDYISPEQARNSRQIDTRSDIYSLGCSLYHMLAGRVPFPAPSLAEKLFAHQSAEPDPLYNVVPGVPEGLEAVVATMMKKQPEDRYPRPAAVARALEPFAHADHHPGIANQEPSPAEEPDPAASQLTPAGQSDAEMISISQAREIEPEAVEVTPLEHIVAAVPTAPVEESSSFNLQLDFDTEPTRSKPLSPTTSSSTSTSLAPATATQPAAMSTRRWKHTKVLLSALFVLGALAVTFWPRQGVKPDKQSSLSSKGARPEPPRSKPADPTRPFLVQLGKDNTSAVSTLTDAIGLTAGKTAEILIHDTQPINLELDEPLDVVGNLTLRAAPGNHPRLNIHLLKPVPFLDVAAHGSSLRIEGVSLHVSMHKPPGKEKPVIKAKGNLALDQCEIVGDGISANVIAVEASGSRITLNRCSIQGFSTALDWLAGPHAEASLENVLLVGSGTAPWPIVVNIHEGRNQGKRTLHLNHCTVIGSGLARIQNGKSSTPLDIRIRSTITVGRWLLDWQGLEPFPDGLAWSGEENLYDLGGDGWLAGKAGELSPESVPLGGRTHKLSDWTQGNIKERGSQARSVEFNTMPASLGKTPGDFELKNGTGFLEPLPGIEQDRLPGPLD